MPLSRGRRKKNDGKKGRGGWPGPERFWVEDQAVDMTAMMAKAQRIAETVDDHVRVCFQSDPEMGGGLVVTGVDERTGRLTHDGQDTIESMPAARFEPTQALMLSSVDGATPAREGQVEAAILNGLQRWTGTGILKTAAGWQIVRTAVGLELRSPDGSVFSRGELVLPPVWVSAAVSRRYVHVVYGAKVGVRTPPNLSKDRYTPASRWQELRDAQRAGIVAAGIVQYVNQAG